MPVLFCFSGEGKWSFFAGNIYTERFLYYNTVAKKNFDEAFRQLLYLGLTYQEARETAMTIMEERRPDYD